MDSRRAICHAPPATTPVHTGQGLTQRPWWRWLKRGAGALFFLFVGGLLFSQARLMEWSKVFTSLQNYPLTTAGSALLLAVLSLILYSCFDLLGRAYTGHKLGTAAVMSVTFVSYAFTLTLGSLVGSIATRYRLYSRLGLRSGVIARIVSLSIVTNWIGYVLLAGLVFSFQPPAMPDNWSITTVQLRFAGFALLGASAAYLVACAFLQRRELQIRGHAVALPSIGLACLQLLMGAANWLTMSGIVFVLLQQRIGLAQVASVLLLAAIAGVIVHIPAGLGVLEAVFVALLSHKLPVHDLLAALVAYRVVYYLLPLGAAALLYAVMEARAKKLPHDTHTT